MITIKRALELSEKLSKETGKQQTALGRLQRQVVNQDLVDDPPDCTAEEQALAAAQAGRQAAAASLAVWDILVGAAEQALTDCQTGGSGSVTVSARNEPPNESQKPKVHRSKRS